MARMEIHGQNLLNTTTLVVVDSGSNTVENLFDRNPKIDYSTVDYSSDTSTIINVNFTQPQVVSHIIMQNHNLRDFRVFYDSVTANSINVTTSNSATSTYLALAASTTVSSLQVQLDAAQTSDTEKAVGELVILNRDFVFDRNPSHKDFKPRQRRTRVSHRMPDGGLVHFNIANKYEARLKWKFITTSFKNDLFSVFDAAQPFYFIPFPTTGTDWDGQAFEVVWANDFDFTFNDNSKTQGFGGQVTFRETSNA